MSYPNGPGGPGGYQQQPPQQGGSVFGQPPSAPNPLAGMSVPSLLTLAVFVLGLVQYFCSFGGGSGIEVWTLLAGGLLAGLAVLPKAPNTLPIAAVLSVVGGLAILDTVINASGGGVPTAVILILVIGLLQAVVAVVVLLMEYGIVKLAPRPAVPHSAPTYPTGGGYQQGGNQSQATTYMQQPQQQPQSTQFMQHPGQISHPNE